MNKIVVIIGALVLLVVFGLGGFYNNLVSKSQKINNQWAQVETQYQRRFDLIPNLVKSVEASMKQEQKIFGDLAKARAAYSGATTPEDKAKAATQVESALGRLLVVVENYPELKSNENVRQLMDELSGTENRISVERKRYNDEIKDYNTTVIQFPGNLIAPIFGFTSRSYFQAVSGAEKPVEVDINP